MKLIRIFLLVLAIPIGAFALFLLYATIDDFRPGETEPLVLAGKAGLLAPSDTLHLLNWNIGYAGLDASMDFFYDGGEQIRPSEEGSGRNLEGIISTLSAYKDFDFILLQEVDRDSKRSYHLDQTEAIGMNFPLHHRNFALNYNVSFVPIPPKEPMGKVESGLLSLSRPVPAAAMRHSFPGNYSWPMGIFMLDRCFLVQRFNLENSKELLIINTHNSAYDDGSLRSAQMDYLKDFLLEEYEKGNYVIVGGDWNQSPYGLEPSLPAHVFDTVDLVYIEAGYPAADWTWAYDSSCPTNRRVSTPYDRATSPTTIIDCYLLSPNLQMLEVETIDLDFRYSDHQPVRLKVVPKS